MRCIAVLRVARLVAPRPAFQKGLCTVKVHQCPDGTSEASTEGGCGVSPKLAGVALQEARLGDLISEELLCGELRLISNPAETVQLGSCQRLDSDWKVDGLLEFEVMKARRKFLTGELGAVGREEHLTDFVSC